MKNYLTSTEISKDQEVKARDKNKIKEKFITHAFIVISVILSGFLLYLDKILKVLNIDSSFNAGFKDFYTFIWVVMQSVSPLFLLLAISLFIRKHKWVLLIPTYSYSLQISWIVSFKHSDDFLGYLFALGFVIVCVIIYVAIRQLITFVIKYKAEDKEFLEYSRRITLELKNQIKDLNTPRNA